jgi:uncharacterized membrane protein YqaE (UPF0057 family)
MQNKTLELVLKIILSVVLPPAAAFWQVRLSVHFWVNLVLTLFGGLPGIIHALWLVLRERHKVLDIELPRATAESSEEKTE